MYNKEPSKIAILVNKSARQGMAEKYWNKIRNQVINYFPAETLIIEYNIPFNTEEVLKNLYLNLGIDGFISAGGDGSLNVVLNVLMSLKNQFHKHFFLGGIGLGSSNDFLKPAKTWIDGIPVKINWKKNQLVDVGLLSFEDLNGNLITRYFVINASLGITAKANYLFNNPKTIIKSLKKKWVHGAIIYTALKTIFSYENYNAVIIYNNENKNIKLSNLAVIKNPNISGDFKYEQDIKSNDGFLGLNYCDNMDRLELLATLYGLMKGKFTIGSKKKTFKIKTLNIICEEFVPIEADGEIFLGKNIFFKVIPETIYVMGN